MPRPLHHVFICVQQRAEGHPRGSCHSFGAPAIYQKFAEEITTRNLFNSVALNQTGCLGPCNTGANVLVYPEGSLYIQVKPEDVALIVEQHLVKGEPIAEMLAPAEIW